MCTQVIKEILGMNIRTPPKTLIATVINSVTYCAYWREYEINLVTTFGVLC
jgi:hypothetical protein